MTEEHISEIAKLERECFSSPWSENSLTSEINNKLAKFLVAIESEEVLGYGGMHLVGGEGFITNIAVFKKHRNKGVALNICKELISSCSYSISLEVRQSNTVAIKLYEKLGFKKVGQRKNFYEIPTEDAYIYTLLISEI